MALIVLAIAGFGLIAVGAALAYPPAGLIVAGAVMVWAAWQISEERDL